MTDLLREFAGACRREIASAEVIEDYPLGEKTTMKAGGNAALCVLPKDRDAFLSVLRLLRRYPVRYAVLGHGSNLVVSDSGYPGAVIRTEEMKELRITGTEIRADAGVMLSALAGAACEAGLSGLEFAFGIPGTVGGACYMNAGAYGGETAAVLASVTCFDMREGTVREMPVSACRYGYRSSVFMEDREKIILSCAFRLVPGDRETISALMKKNMEARKEKQPLEYPSSGSFFKRCEGRFTAQMIDEAGLKGFSVGDAQISVKHAGFLINRGKASAHDIYELSEIVRLTLKDRYGVEIHREVEFLG